jgi:hypothetical protein
MTKITGSGSRIRIQDPDPGSGSESGSISQRHGSADPDPAPDTPQNVMDPQHWSGVWVRESGFLPKFHGSATMFKKKHFVFKNYFLTLITDVHVGGGGGTVLFFNF